MTTIRVLPGEGPEAQAATIPDAILYFRLEYYILSRGEGEATGPVGAALPAARQSAESSGAGARPVETLEDETILEQEAEALVM